MILNSSIVREGGEYIRKCPSWHQKILTKALLILVIPCLTQQLKLRVFSWFVGSCDFVV